MYEIYRIRLTALIVAASLIPYAPAGASQAADRQAIAAVRPAGEVYVNQARVTEEQTLFTGDTVQTRAGGSAGVSVPGRGALTLGANSRVTLSATRQYFAWLEGGTVALRALADAQNFQIRVGGFVVVPSAQGESAAQIELAADGSGQVVSTTGSVAVIALEGPAAVFLSSGQAASISSQGELKAARVPTTAPPPPAPTEKKKSSRALIVVVAAGGAAGAAVAFTRKKREVVSPARP